MIITLFIIATIIGCIYIGIALRSFTVSLMLPPIVLPVPPVATDNKRDAQ